MVVGPVADLAGFLPLQQGLPHIHQTGILQDLLCLVIELVIVVGPMERGKDFCHEIARRGYHHQVCRNPQLGGELIELG